MNLQRLCHNLKLQANDDVSEKALIKALVSDKQVSLEKQFQQEFEEILAGQNSCPILAGNGTGNLEPVRKREMTNLLSSQGQKIYFFAFAI